MGFEDDADINSLVDEANSLSNNAEKEAAKRQAETLAKMEQNRLDKEKAKQKIEFISAIVQEHLKPIVGDLRDQRGQIEEIKNLLGPIAASLQQMGGAIMQTTPQTDKNATQASAGLPLPIGPVSLGEALNGIAQVIAAWKSSSAPQPQTDGYFNELTKQIVSNMLQAGVDGIMRNVYDNYNPVAPKPLWQKQAQAPPNDPGLQ